jgi:dTDP-4-dehydrorhamnose reductase
MRLYLTGSDGMVGTALRSAIAADPSTKDWKVRGVSIRDFDIGDADAVRESITDFRPDVVLHAAALAIVDECEADPTLAMWVNVAGTHHVASACRRVGARMVYLSSDYVFDGEHVPASGYTESDLPNPLSVYGLTKLAGERIVAGLPQHLIIRTSWLFGGADERTDNVLATIGRARRGELTRLIDDQYGCPTYTGDLAEALVRLLRRGHTGTLHVTNAGAATWFEVGERALRLVDPELARRFPPEPGALDGSGFLGVRPRNSILAGDCLAALGIRLPHWSDALARVCAELVEPLEVAA